MTLTQLFGLNRVLMEEETGGEGNGNGGGNDTGTKAPATSLDTEANKEPVVPKEQPGDDDVLDKAGYAKSQDQGLNYALTFLAKNGFTADNPAVDAAMGGDFSLLKAELAQKGLAGWEQALGLGEQAYERAVKAQEAQQKEVGDLVLKVAEESGVAWEEAVAHIGKVATNEEKTALNELMKSPATARIAAAFITGSFLNGGEGEREPVPAARDAAQTTVSTKGGTLSRAEFTKEMAALRNKMGDSYINSPEAAALYRRLA